MSRLMWWWSLSTSSEYKDFVKIKLLISLLMYLTAILEWCHLPLTRFDASTDI